MATLTVRNLSTTVVKSLKTLARRNRRSMEQEVRAVLEQHVGDRLALLDEIEQSWKRQSRRPKPSEVEAWIGEGTLTIRIDKDIERLLDGLCKRSGQSRSEIVRDALRRELSLRRFEDLRRRVLPFAEARGYLTDEDVVRDVS